MKKIFIVYYQHDNGEVDKMKLTLDESDVPNLKEIFYDSVPHEGAKILEIKEL